MAFNTRADVIHKLLASVSEASAPMGSDEDFEVETATRSLVRQRFWTDGEQFFEVLSSLVVQELAEYCAHACLGWLWKRVSLSVAADCGLGVGRADAQIRTPSRPVQLRFGGGSGVQSDAGRISHCGGSWTMFGLNLSEKLPFTGLHAPHDTRHIFLPSRCEYAYRLLNG
jgi:hypothetical protein